MGMTTNTQPQPTEDDSYPAIIHPEHPFERDIRRFAATQEDKNR